MYRPIPQQCVDLVESMEALKLERYLDIAGYPTIGYGHRLLPSEMSIKVITLDQARAFITQDLGVAASAVDGRTKALVPSLNDNKYSALVSFTFNAGVSAFINSTLLKLLLAGAPDPTVAAQFARWNLVKNPATGIFEPSDGLTRRRKAEAALYLKAA
jgi:lysozyme